MTSQGGSWQNPWGVSSSANQTNGFSKGQTPETARESLRFVFSAEGAFFRDFITEELVRSIDAMSRSQFKALVARLGLTDAVVPLLLPGNIKFVPLSPDLCAEDAKIVDNVAKLTTFLTGGNVNSLSGGGSNSQVARELLPFLPDVATELAPDLIRRLANRLSARVVRELFVDVQN